MTLFSTFWQRRLLQVERDVPSRALWRSIFFCSPFWKVLGCSVTYSLIERAQGVLRFRNRVDSVRACHFLAKAATFMEWIPLFCEGGYLGISLWLWWF